MGWSCMLVVVSLMLMGVAYHPSVSPGRGVHMLDILRYAVYACVYAGPYKCGVGRLGWLAGFVV